MKHITVGLTDDDSIRVLCYLTLMRLADLAPLPVSQREFPSGHLNFLLGAISYP